MTSKKKIKVSQKDINTLREIAELLRSVMYSSAEEGNENLFDEVEDLGRMLGEFDGVPYDPEHNRLTQAMQLVERSSWVLGMI